MLIRWIQCASWFQCARVRSLITFRRRRRQRQWVRESWRRNNDDKKIRRKKTRHGTISDSSAKRRAKTSETSINNTMTKKRQLIKWTQSNNRNFYVNDGLLNTITINLPKYLIFSFHSYSLRHSRTTKRIWISTCREYGNNKEEKKKKHSIAMKWLENVSRTRRNFRISSCFEMLRC